MLKKTFFALSLSLGLACSSAVQAAAPAAVLDLNNPEDVLKTDRKIQSSLNDGEESVYYWEGSVYTRIAGERDKQLFKYWGMNIRATKGFQDPVKGYGYRMVSRELLFYLDPKTGEIMRTWKNPWSNETVEIVHIANDPVNMPPQFAKGDRGPTKFRGTVMEDKIMYTYEIPLFYANPLAGDYQDYVGGTYHAMEIFNFIADKNELLDATKSTAYPSIAWSRVSKFLPWMKMGDRQGYMIFSGTGKKLAGGFNALPDGIKKEIATNYPIYNKAPPLDDTRPNETSWTYFKTEMEKKKAKK
jgi:Protein of unknown function (DUF1838)